MDALLRILQAQQTLEVSLNFGIILPKHLHEVEVRPLVASFFLAKREQLIYVPVSMVQRDMIDPAVPTKSMPTRVVVKLSIPQTHPTLPKQCRDFIILLILDDIPSGLFLIEQIIKVIGVEVGEVVEHERPSIGHGAEHRLHRDLLPNLLEQLIEMVDGVRTILRQPILQGQIIDLILILLLVFVILLLEVFIIVAFLHLALLGHQVCFKILDYKAVLARFSKVKSRRAYKIIQQIDGKGNGGNRKVGGFVMLEKVRAWVCSHNYIMFLGVRALNLFRAVPKMTLFAAPRAPFSQFFDKQDEGELKNAFESQYKKKFLHFKLTDQWQKPLQRKARRKQRKLEIAKTKVQPENDIQKLVVHNPAVGIQYPAKSTETFAVIQVDGFQYKVLEDATLILDTKQEHQINKPIFFKQVPLIGTKSYTLIGRPTIGEAYVEAMVESISSSKKVIVFKKKRRKNYKRSFGSRVSLTQVRITKIFHSLKEEVLSKAIALQ